MNFAFPGRGTFRTRPPGKTRHQTAPRKPRQRTQEAGEPGVRGTGLTRGRDGGGTGAGAELVPGKPTEQGWGTTTR